MAKPIGGRRLGDEHAAMVKSGVDRSFRLRWLLDQPAEWDAEGNPPLQISEEGVSCPYDDSDPPL